jgi:ribonucleoside-diphosphate reductase alpha subunit
LIIILKNEAILIYNNTVDMAQREVVRHIINRNGKQEPFDISKIQERLKHLANMSIPTSGPIDTDIVSISDIVSKIGKNIYNGIKTSELDNLTAEECIQNISIHPDFDRMAARILVSNLHKEILPGIRTYAETLYRHRDKFGRHFPRLSEQAYNFYCKYHERLDRMLDHDRDFLYKYFGIKTECEQYLLKVIDQDSKDNIPTKVAERPQQLHLRVAIHGEIDIANWDVTTPVSDETFDNIKRAYDMMSCFVFTHATPTRLNSCTPRYQLISCNLDAFPDDSAEILDAIKRAGLLSRDGAGLGYGMSDLRSSGSPIFGTGGCSEGPINYIKMMQATMYGFNQGGGKRKGAAQVSLEVWHPDIEMFLDIRLQHGDDAVRARTLNHAIIITDEFQHRILNDDDWYLLDPHDCPGLVQTWGKEFSDLYNQYVKQGRYRRKMKARHLFKTIAERLIETGQPFITFKDNVNRKSNQQGWGTVTHLNLCTEVALVSGKVRPRPQCNEGLVNPKFKPDSYSQPINEVANCNLASINVNAFFNPITFVYDFEGLARAAAFITRRLNNIIDNNRYTLEVCRETNTRHRPIGIGIQGLQNLFYSIGYEWGSPEALQLDADIMEAIYYGAINQSIKLAREFGPYETYSRSPAAMGFLQPDLWILEKSIRAGNLPDLPIAQLLTDYKDKLPQKWEPRILPETGKPRFDWAATRGAMYATGLYNSELTAPPPTASTSQVLGNYESFEPAASNLYIRTTMSGSFTIINPYLVNDFAKLGIWNTEMRNLLISSGGSLKNLPDELQQYKRKYRTVWEIPQKVIVQAALARAIFVTMSPSLNTYFENPTPEKIETMVMYAWKQGLKSLYYVRTRQGASVQSFGITSSDKKESEEKIYGLMREIPKIDTRQLVEATDDSICFACGS